MISCDAASNICQALPIDARELGHKEDAAAAAAAAGFVTPSGHDVPPGVFAVIAYWLSKGGYDSKEQILGFRSRAVEGAMYCYNEGCEVIGQMKDFKICPRCRVNRYCGAACQKWDWTTGGHKLTCGTFASHVTK